MSHRPHAQRHSKNVCVAMEDALVEMVDAAAGAADASRSEWVRSAIEEKLGRDTGEPQKRRRLKRGWKR